MREKGKGRAVGMRNLFIVPALACSLLAGQIVYAAEGDYAEAENVLDVDPVYTDEVIDITGYTIINDRVGFDEQKNYYSFIAPVDGEYRFDFIPSPGIQRYTYEMKDEFGGLVALDDWELNESEEKLWLDEGMSYTIEVGQLTKYGKYSIEIDYPSSAQQFLDDFSAGDTVAAADVEENTETVEKGGDTSVSSEVSSNEDLILQQLEELQSRLDELESEINEVKDENENLKIILDENEIEYD